MTNARDRLAVHMHHIFQHQANRRFVYGLVITQSTFIVHCLTIQARSPRTLVITINTPINSVPLYLD